ncbi:MAG: hypothetical protein EXR59_03045 [Dehalococcoidia bacterium]|nr:hypothetical protein [Dehalococcoidia bacterium]
MQPVQQRRVRPCPVDPGYFMELFSLKTINRVFVISPKLGLLLILLLCAFAASSCTKVKSAQGWAGPIVNNGTLYAFTLKDGLIGLNPQSGNPKPKLNSAGNPEVDDKGRPVYLSFSPKKLDKNISNASYSTPLFVNETSMLITARLANQRDSQIVKLDPKTFANADLLTTTVFGRINDDLLLVSDTIYISSVDHNLYAIDVSNGTPKWSKPYNAGAELWAAPALYKGRLYVGDTSGKLVSLDPKTSGDVQVITEVEGSINMTPLIVNDVAYFGTFGNKMYAVNVVTKDQVWSKPIEADKWFWARPIISDGVLYVAGMDNYLYAINAATGNLKWRYLLTGPARTAPVIVDKTLIVATVNYGNQKGRVHAFDISNPDGGPHFFWDKNARSSVIAPLNVKDKIVYFTNIDGDYFALDVPQRKLLWEHTAP